MQQPARIRFYGSLNDFLPRSKRNEWISYRFNGIPAVKDAIEALGVPHVEVAAIHVNGTSAVFYTPLHPGDRVEVYPIESVRHSPQFPLVRNESDPPDKFVADVHLGALARLLRLLGFDTCHQTDYDDLEIALLAETQNRIALTRDINLLKQKRITWGYWLRSQHPREQLIEIITRFQLSHLFKPFTRCLACNGFFIPVSKDSVASKLPPDTVRYFNEFYQCTGCHRIYWKGSHYNRMLKIIEEARAINRRRTQ